MQREIPTVSFPAPAGTAGVDVQADGVHVFIPHAEPLDARDPGWQPPAQDVKPQFPTLEQLAAEPGRLKLLETPAANPSDRAFEDALSLAFWLRQQCQGNAERMLAAVNGVHALLAEAQGEEIFRFERTDHPSMVEASH